MQLPAIRATVGGFLEAARVHLSSLGARVTSAAAGALAVLSKQVGALKGKYFMAKLAYPTAAPAILYGTIGLLALGALYALNKRFQPVARIQAWHAGPGTA